jgi:hypothetical protein
MSRVENQVVTVPLSGMVSGDIAIAGAREIALIAPALTSCQAFLQGNFDTTSAGFVRVAQLDGSGDFVWTTGVGSNALSAEVLKPFAFARIELDIDQAVARDFSVVRKF